MTTDCANLIWRGSFLVLCLSNFVCCPSALRLHQNGEGGAGPSLTSTSDLASETALACSHFDGISKDFCLSTFGQKKRNHMADYKRHRSTCLWQPFRGHYSHSRFEPITQQFVDLTSNVTVNICTTDVESDEKMFIYKIGPFASHGDHLKWYRFGIEGILADYVQKAVGLRSFLQAPVDEKGDILGRPPIHIHHNHFGDEQCNAYGELFNLTEHLPSLDTTHRLVYTNPAGDAIWADTHGDKQCAEALGGTDCLLRKFPDGWAEQMRIGKSGCAFADHIDIRPSDSPLMLWWVENMFTITEKPQQIIGLTAFGPAHFRMIFGKLMPTSEYNVDARNETIVWSSMSAQHDGTALQVLTHTHRSVTEDFWLVKGRPTDIGLDKMPFCNPATLDQWNLYPFFDMHRENLVWRMRQLEAEGKAEMLCNTSTSHRNLWETVDDVEYERLVPIYCKDFSFKKGDILTTISFHRARPSKKQQLMKDPIMGMHSGFYLYSNPANVTTDVHAAINHIDGVGNEAKALFEQGRFTDLISANDPRINADARP